MRTAPMLLFLKVTRISKQPCQIIIFHLGTIWARPG